MNRRIIAVIAALAVLLVGGCSQVAGPVNPPPASVQVTSITVPSVTDMTQAAAVAQLKAIGLTAFVRYTADAANAGKVVAQLTPVGNALAPGQAVDIVVAYDPAKRIVPDVLGDVKRDAEASLLAAGLTFSERVDATAVSTDTSITAGMVYKQDPGAGASLPRGSVVKLTFLGHL